ncbi:MAG: hypothetical protein IJ702_08455 [Fretibacterium sp.]|nr:hypothetical protein [Fretibacterium sp.]
MRKNSGRPFLALLLAAALGTVLAMGADAAMSARQPRRHRALPPVGWKYDSGYALWRARKGQPATASTWRRYAHEKSRLAYLGRGTNALFLNKLDGALEEISGLWEGEEKSAR